MKTKDIFRSWLLAASFSLLSLALIACSGDNGPSPVPEPDPVPDNVCRVTLSIPSMNFGATRAGETVPIDTEAGEGHVESLYLVIFKENEAGTAFEYCDPYCIDIAPQINDNSQMTGNYDDSYYNQIRLLAGRYKFYLLGNIYYYWSRANGGASKAQFESLIQSEDNINGLTLNFLDKFEASNLPMACLAPSFCRNSSDDPLVGDGSEADAGKGILEITDDDIADGLITLYAPLTILASKVRYTFLFDNTPGSDAAFSSAFSSADIVFNEQVALSNVVKTTSMIAPVALGDEPEFITGLTGALYRTEYPSGDKSAYLDKDRTVVPASLSRLETDAPWGSEHQRAWQGIVYLPENSDFTSSSNTTLLMTATGKGTLSDGYPVPVPDMNRGWFYDVVARLKTPVSFDISVFVAVSPWVYNPGDQPSDW